MAATRALLPPAGTDGGRDEVPSETHEPERSPSGVARLLSAFPYLGLGLVFLVLCRVAAAPLTNTDTYFHLRYGHEFLSGDWSLRHPGSVSTFGTAHWLPTQWLPEIVMAQTEQWFGLAGVAWLAGLLFLTLAMTIFLVARRWATPWRSLVVLVLTLAACSPGMSMRPQQISYLLVLVTSAAWLRTRTSGRAPWILVPLTFGWAMCHGMWPTGIVISAVAVVGLALDGRARGAQLARLAVVPVASAAMAAITPVGPGLYGAVLLVSSRGKYFSEWGSPTFTRPYGVALLALLALACLPRLRRGRVPWFEILLIGLAGAWAVYSTRTMPVAACLLVPLVASGLQNDARPRPARRVEKLAVLGGYAACLGLLAVLVPHTSAQPMSQPSWESSALGSLPPGTKVLDASAEGGFLMWRYPNLDLVSHGYGDAFTDAELKRNAAIEQLQPGWISQIEATGARIAVVDPRSPLGYALIHGEHWRVAAGSTHDTQVLLRAPSSWPTGRATDGVA